MDTATEYGFLFDTIQVNSEAKIAGKSIVQKNKRRQQLIQRMDELAKAMKPIEKNTTLHLITSENFGSIELLRHITQKHKPKTIYITTWSINQEFVHMVEELLKDNVQIFFFVDTSLKGRKNHLAAQMVSLAYEHKNLTIKYHYKLHSKITLIESEGMHITIEGSANYSENTRVENFTITESKELFNFHKEWMTEIIK